MIKLRGNSAVFTGKDQQMLEQTAKDYGMSPQDVFTGMLWEYVMKSAREGVFKRVKAKIQRVK